MELRVENERGVTVLTLPGEHLDAANAEDFKKSVAPMLDQSNHVAMDLSNLKFVDSSGLGALLSCLRKLKSKGGDLKLFNMTKQVRQLFELVRMHRIMDVLVDREAVLNAFGK